MIEANKVSTVQVTPREKVQKKYNDKPSRKAAMERFYARRRSDPEAWAKHKIQVAERMRESRIRAMTTAYMLLGGRCEGKLRDGNACQVNDMQLLELDHVNNDGYKDRGVGKHALCRQVLENPSRFQLLCANCHTLRHHTEWRGQAQNVSA